MTIARLALLALVLLPSLAWAQASPAGIMTTVEGSVSAVEVILANFPGRLGGWAPPAPSPSTACR
jgi:hypothetical protein